MVTLLVAGWIARQRFQPAGPDEQARQSISEAWRLEERARGCLSDNTPADLQAKFAEASGLKH